MGAQSDISGQYVALILKSYDTVIMNNRNKHTLQLKNSRSSIFVESINLTLMADLGADMRRRL